MAAKKKLTKEVRKTLKKGPFRSSNDDALIELGKRTIKTRLEASRSSIERAMEFLSGGDIDLGLDRLGVAKVEIAKVEKDLGVVVRNAADDLDLGDLRDEDDEDLDAGSINTDNAEFLATALHRLSRTRLLWLRKELGFRPSDVYGTDTKIARSLARRIVGCEDD